MEAPAKASKSPQLKVEWNLPQGVEPLSEGHVYYAHRLGFEQGQGQDAILLKKNIYENSELAFADTLKVIDLMRKMGIEPISAHLKVPSRYSIKVLITVSNEDFVKGSFIDLYPQVNSIQQESKTDLYSISFTFINRSANFDEELVKLDGFVGSYKPSKKVK